MKRTSYLLSAAPALIVFGLCLAVVPGLQAQESDLSSAVAISEPVTLDTPTTVTMSYTNNGPNDAASGVIDVFSVYPGGLDVFVDNTVNGDESLADALQDSAWTTDTQGNFPFLFWDDNYCEDILFQLKGDETGELEVAIASGDTGSFTYQVTIPMESPNTGSIAITEPASLAQAWTGNNNDVFDAAAKNLFGRGSCEKFVGGEDEEMCSYISDNCFGARISQLDEPIEAEWELVNDGSADPTFGCETFADFTPGNIALLRRGGCQFGTKAFNAEQAQASAMVMVFDDNCNGNSTSDQCTFGMLAGDLGGLVAIPVASLAMADGEPIIAAIEGGATVMGVFGASSPYQVQGNAWLLDAGETDPDDTNDYSVATAEVSAIPPAPVAAFTYSPAEPTTGEAVMFMDASTGGAPASWAWDFGDGSTSTEQNPSHTYATASTFNVSLMVTNGGGSDSTSMEVVVAEGTTFSEMYFIPAAALAAGLEGAFFQTDVDINNAGAGADSFAFQWLPRGENNSEPMQSSNYTLASGASVRFENVLEEVFGFEPNVAGALAVVSNTTDLKVQSRTYDVSVAATAGTFGQALPGVPSADLIAQNDVKRIIFMSENDSLRANLGCVNGMNDNLPIRITSYDAAGTELEMQTMTLAPYSNNQINQILGDFAPTNGYVDVTSIKVGAGYYCYGSVLDNLSNDPTSILPTEYGADAPFVNYFIPAAALAAGLEGAFFQTDVDINNGGAAMATYNFMWLPRGENNSDATVSESFTLAAGASVRYENVLEEVFGLEPDVAGALAVSADTASLGVMSRTYDVSVAATSGTFGQAIPGIPAGNLITQNETRRIIFMSENDSLRANLGCVNGVDDNVPIDITTYDSEGVELETQRMTLGPWSNNQINQIFRDFAPTNGYADVTSIKATAGFYCYGSVLDNLSNDPTTILPQ